MAGSTSRFGVASMSHLSPSHPSKSLASPLRVLNACSASSLGGALLLALVTVHWRTSSSVVISTASQMSCCAGLRNDECTSEQLFSVAVSTGESEGAR